MGKSHFCANLQGQKYKFNVSTDGIVCSDVAVSDYEVEFKVMDFAGQEVREIFAEQK